MLTHHFLSSMRINLRKMVQFLERYFKRKTYSFFSYYNLFELKLMFFITHSLKRINCDVGKHNFLLRFLGAARLMICSSFNIIEVHLIICFCFNIFADGWDNDEIMCILLYKKTILCYIFDQIKCFKWKLGNMIFLFFCFSLELI